MAFHQTLSKIFGQFGIGGVEVSLVGLGPSLGRFALKVPVGTKVSKIRKLTDDVALALGVPAVWITEPIAPWTLGIDIPRRNREFVNFRDLADADVSAAAVPLYLGVDVVGEQLVPDLAKFPHLLVAGRTGSGKSVALHSIIRSVLKQPDVRLCLIDPKQVEFEEYRHDAALIEDVVTDPQDALEVLARLVRRMNEGFEELKRHHVKSIDELTSRGISRNRVVVVVDELADLLMTGDPLIERHLIRLAQKGRAVGIHLVLATQRPTVDVLSGLLKANVPSRLAFQVASALESRVILDNGGAEKLLGCGDFLLQTNGGALIRGQAAYFG